MNIKYQSFDGKLFNTKLECVEYEKNTRFKAYDQKGKEVPDPIGQWADVYYFNTSMLNQESCEALASLMNDPHNGPARNDDDSFPEFPGRWFWNEWCSMWCDFDEVYDIVEQAKCVFEKEMANCEINHTEN